MRKLSHLLFLTTSLSWFRTNSVLYCLCGFALSMMGMDNFQLDRLCLRWTIFKGFVRRQKCLPLTRSLPTASGKARLQNKAHKPSTVS